MLNDLLNLNIESCSETELKAWVRQVIPIVTKFIQASTIYVQTDENLDKAFPCHTCIKIDTCTENSCEAIKAFLSSKDKGNGYKEKTLGISFEKFADMNSNESDRKQYSTSNRDSLKTIAIISSLDVYADYQKCWGDLTDKQQKAITLRYRDGLSQKQIAERIDRKSSAVSDLLKRAGEVKEKYKQKLRSEKFDLLKKLNTE